MGLKLITGKTGTAHVASADDRARIAATFGPAEYVVDSGNGCFAATIVDNNNISIGAGDLVAFGTHARIAYGDTEAVIIDSGAVGYNRVDLIVVEYKNTSGVESGVIKVVKGIPSSGAPATPSVTAGNVLQGASTNQTILYKVTLNGINIVSCESMFTIISLPLASIAAAYSQSSTYALGAIVSYGGKLYECTTAISSPEAWTAGHWTLAILGDLLASHTHTPESIGALPYDAISSSLIINGGFDFWQRGTAQTLAGMLSADRWINSHSGSTTKTTSRQSFTEGQTDVPNNPTYFIRHAVTSGGGAADLCLMVQNVEDVTKLSGKTVTLSFYAKANAAKSISVEAVQIFGTGGSASVTGTGVSKLAITTTWTLYSVTINVPSVSGKSIGAGSYTQFVFWLDAGSNYNARTASLGNQSGTFDIANVQLNYGSAALPFVPLRYDDELRRCRRYYRRYSSEVAYGALAIGQAMTATSADIIFVFDEMRISPTMVSSAASLLTLTYGNASLTLGSAIAQLVTSKISATVRVTIGFAILAAGQATLLSIFTDTSAFVAFDAEL